LLTHLCGVADLKVLVFIADASLIAEVFKDFLDKRRVKSLSLLLEENLVVGIDAASRHGFELFFVEGE
jgi:hypothetical protein